VLSSGCAFQVLSKNVSIQADIALSALEKFLFNGLYKFTYSLTYLLVVLMKLCRSRQLLITVRGYHCLQIATSIILQTLNGRRANLF